VGLRVALDSRTSNDVRLHFVVSDTGVGIPPEKQKLIFEAFSQADGSTGTQVRRHRAGFDYLLATRGADGLGRSGWKAPWDRAAPFTSRLTLGAGKEVVETHPAAAPACLAGLGALVVDDNATNRRILEEMLSRLGMRPKLAESGLVAFQSLKQAKNSFAVILTDLNMPDMDGFTLVEQLRHSPELAGEAKVIMLTSAGQTRRRRALPGARRGAYLTKPVSQSELFEAIVRVLGMSGSQPEPAALITRHTIREGKKKLRVLLAEDNVINQSSLRACWRNTDTT